MNPSVKVAQPGWNAQTAPDWALIFSSDWPSLQIAFETTIPLSKLPTSVTHNLGFPPLTSVWLTVNGQNYGRLAIAEVSDTQVLLFISSLTSYSGTVTIRCYNVDISQEARYPLPVSASAKGVPDLTTSIKIVKQNPTRGIDSPILNDFILNSQAQSPAILQIATQKGQYFNPATQIITYPLQTSYIPWVLGALDVSGNGTEYDYFSPDTLTYNQSANSISLNVASTGAGSLIIMRDPLIYPNTVRVVY